MVKPEDKPTVVLRDGRDSTEWPDGVKSGLAIAAMAGDESEFSLLCAIGLNHRTKNVSAFFSPRTSQNPHLDELCDEVADMFRLMAKRLRQ